MTINKADISNTSTFGTWKTRTNELLAFARKTVSLGASGENNDGDLVLNGDLTLGSVNPTTDTLTVNNISKCATGDLKILNDIEVEGTLILDTGAGQVSKLQFNNGGSETFSIETASDHSYLEIGDGTSFIRFQADGSGGKEIDGESIKINNDILPDEITAVNFTSTGTGADRSVLAEVNISAGTISGLTALGSTSATLASVDIEAGTIDNTAIGTTTQSTGKFTSVDTVSNGDFTAHGTGGFKGDLKNSSGGTVVDVDAATPVLYGQSTGLTGDAITEVLKAVYPIGSLYTSTTGVDPSTARAADNTGGLGFGTWERYAQGRVLAGYDGGSLTVTNGHYSVRNAYLDIYGAEYTCVFYFDDYDSEEEVGLGPGDRVDVNVGGITLDSNNPLPWTQALGNNSGAGFEVLESGMSATFTGVPYIRIDVSDMVNSNSAYSSVWPTVTSTINIQVGGVDLTGSNGFTVRNNRFRNAGDNATLGGMGHVKLDPKHIPDHVHIMKSPLTGIEYYGVNDDNVAPALLAGQSFGPTHNSLQYTEQIRDTEYLAQFGDTGSDGQYNRNTGLVRHYNGNQIVEIDVDQGHENMPPYQVVYIYRRTA